MTKRVWLVLAMLLTVAVAACGDDESGGGEGGSGGASGGAGGTGGVGGTGGRPFDVCGDGLVTGAERCDDGNEAGGDGCSADCLSDERCGNGVLDTAAGELCDDGGNVNGDACSADCRSREECGNGTVDVATGEACDDGNTIGGDGCSATCLPEFCGNGLLDAEAGERCDDGNNTSGDGCAPDCRSLELCGDGVVDPAIGERCDDANLVDGDGCSADCRSLEVCGDGLVDVAVGERCDDGNALDGDGCSADCRSFEVCGNAILDAAVGERCDDGNTLDGDGCTADCGGLEVCGDGRLDGLRGEACDDGNVLPFDGCDPTCQFEPCGNGVIESPQELCDDGNNVDGDGCSAACQLPAAVTSLPVPIGAGCTLPSAANTGRKAAVDANGRLYALVACGNLAVATSEDFGASWSAPVDLGFGGIESAIAGGRAGVAHVSGIGPANELLWSRTTDGGATWSPPVAIDAGVSASWIGLAVDDDSDFVAIAASFGGPARLLTSATGAEPFAGQTVGLSVPFGDVLFDRASDVLHVVGDTPELHLFTSTDLGVTIGADQLPPGTAFFSDWAVGADTVFAVGSSSPDADVDVIPVANPAGARAVPGLATPDLAQGASIAANRAGDAFVAVTPISGALTVDRLRASTGTIDAADRVELTPSGGSRASLVALPSLDGVLVVYEVNGQATAQVVAW